MTEPRRAILLLGSPHAGVREVARDLHRHGAVLPSDTSGAAADFAVSPSLAALADRLNAEVGVSIDEPGPVSVSGRALERSQAAVAAHRRGRLAETCVAIARVAGERNPLLVTGEPLGVLAGFWHEALTAAGFEVQVVLAVRNPLADAQLARAAGGTVVRRSLFAWQALTLDALSLPEVVVVQPAEREERALLGGLSAEPLVPAHPRDGVDLKRAPLVAAQTRDLYALAQRWNASASGERAEELRRLRAAFDEAVTVTGAARPSPITLAQPAATPSDGSEPPPATEARPALFHYHLFKNAGTSVDAMLEANFGERWEEREFPAGTQRERHAAATEWVRDRPELVAFSSHTAPLPPPQVEGRRVIPILFVRHPVLRLYSAYRFERRQDAETKGARLAKANDFRGYVDALLVDPATRQARDFHVGRLAPGTPGKRDDELARALATVASLPFVGLVESYRLSLERLAEIVRPMIPQFRPIVAEENSSGGGGDGDVESRLREIGAEIGAPLFERLLDANRGDLMVWERVRATYPA